MESKDTNSIQFADYNPRIALKPFDDSLEVSLTSFGDIGGITSNRRTNRYVTGHQRVRILNSKFPGRVKIYIQHNFEQPDEYGTVATGFVGVEDTNLQLAYREVDWDEGREKAANIAANKIEAQWDNDMLAKLNYDIGQLDNGTELLAMTGQSAEELTKLLDSVGALGENPEDDNAPPLDDVNPAASQLGEIYQLGRHRLMCGSSTDFGQLSDLLDGHTPELAFTDPPYGIDIVNNSGMVGSGKLAETKVYDKVVGDDGIETAKAFWAIVEQLGIKKTIMWGGNYFTGFLPFSDGWLVWDKRGDMNGNNFADGEMAWCSFHTALRIYKQIWNGMIREGESEQRIHPTQKPVKMLAEVLADFSNRGEIVLDGFGGSGSTLIACEKMERICYMAELSPAYCDLIRKRYHKHVTGSEEGWQQATPVINIEVAAAV